MVLPLPLSPTTAVMPGCLRVDREGEALKRNFSLPPEHPASEVFGDVA